MKMAIAGIECCIGMAPGWFMLIQNSQLRTTESQERKSTEEFKSKFTKNAISGRKGGTAAGFLFHFSFHF